METITTKQIVLTEEQQAAVNSIVNWALAPLPNIQYNKEADAKDAQAVAIYKGQFDPLYACLKGSAGTGKTTVLKEIVSQIRKKTTLAISAPTHKAKKVVSKAVDAEAITIQAALGLKPDTDLEDFNPNKPVFNPKAEERIKDYKIFIIDESSMLNTDLYELLLKKSRAYKTKILFVGDELQLPPVKEDFSKALTEPKHMVSLTKVIRQEDTNPLAILLSMLRDDILNKTDNFLQYINNSLSKVSDKMINGLPVKEGYVCLSKTDFAADMILNFSSEAFMQNKDHVKYITWTNKGVQDTNAYIRKCIMNIDVIVVPTDLLMGYNTVTVDDEVVITNSEDYIVTDVTPGEKDGIPGYHVTLKLDSNNVLLNRITVFIIDHEDCDEFLETWEELLQRGKDYKAWKPYYAFKNKYLLLNNIYEDDGKKLKIKKDLDYGYAITIHKTQGSTYENIFVNLREINMCKDDTQRRKLTYVALSRASRFCTILI